MIYTIGYANVGIKRLVSLADDLDANVIDIRLKPWSGKPGFTRLELEDELGPKYAHLPDLGNLNYKEGGPVVLKGPEKAIPKLVALLDEGVNLILLCGCKHLSTCHRRDVSVLLRIASKHEVKELKR